MIIGQQFRRLGSKITGMSGKRKALVAGVAVVLILGGIEVAVASSGGGHKPPAAATMPMSTSASPTPTPTTPAKATPKPKPKPKPNPKAKPVNPLTGIGAPPKGSVVAVKIDDTANGRPQVGIDRADIVYVEQAEGGLTRLVAVYASNKPTVGYVRSVRTSDPELLSQYGRIILAASGGGGDSIPTLNASILHPDLFGPGMYKIDSRESPYSTMLNVAQASQAIAGNGVQSVGFTFSSSVPAGGHAAPAIHTVVGSTPVNFGWYPKGKSYIRSIDGVQQQAADGMLVRATNVIVQYCDVTVHPGDVDVLGNPAQYTHSIGKGKVVVFRNGKQYDGTWSRAGLRSGTILMDGHGKPIPLAPGNTWVILVSTGAPLSAH